jgi:hypothetical protein
MFNSAEISELRKFYSLQLTPLERVELLLGKIATLVESFMSSQAPKPTVLPSRSEMRQEVFNNKSQDSESISNALQTLLILHTGQVPHGNQ